MAEQEEAGQTPEQQPDRPVPQSIRNMNLKATAALERNPDMAIDMLFNCVKACPWFLEARTNLRKAEIARYLRKHGGHAKASPFAGIAASLKKGKVQGLVKKGKLEDAVLECENLLKDDPLNINYIKLFAETAIAAGRASAGLMTMEVAREHIPANDLDALTTLGTLYFQTKDYKKARECLERVHRARPNDAAIAKMLKNAEALATLNSGWEQAHKSGDYRDTLKDKKLAEELEAANKSVKSATDAATLIEDAKRKIEREPKNVNYYLSLVGLLLQQKQYDEGLAWISKAREIIGQDPELDRRYSAVKIEKFNADIETATEAGDADAAANLTVERDQYIFDDIAERVQRYPNDQHLRFELGEQYWKYHELDPSFLGEAIQQFQISQRSPKDRVQSLYLMAECFRVQGMLDMAVEQLKSALESLPSMNADKMNVFYLMGEISEQQGDLEEAARYFKEIYRADVTYKDIATRVQNIYAAQAAAKAKKQSQGAD